MKRPLITIICPCSGHSETLGLALHSLQVQTWQEWRCLVVEDGAGQGVQEVVAGLADERFEVIKLASRRGRGGARQAALDRAEGDYVAMLDADDWYLPGKLARQVDVLEARQELSALAMGMVVVDDQGGLLGVRSCGEIDGGEELEVRRVEPGNPPAIGFSTVMIRRDVAQSARFDTDLERSEDWDYLMRALGGKLYGVLPEVGYVYREAHTEARMEAALTGFRCQRRLFRGLLFEAPLAASREYVKSLIKTGVYSGARYCGGGEWLFRRRNREATAEEKALFYEGLEALQLSTRQ